MFQLRAQPSQIPGMEVGEGVDRHPHTIGLWFLTPALSHMHFIKLMNYEEVIKKLGVNEVSGVSHLIGSTTQHLFWLKIRSTVLISYVRKPACLSQEKVILTKAEKQNIKQKAGKQMLEDIKRNGKQANATKTAPRTDEQELESSWKRERERMVQGTAPALRTNCQGRTLLYHKHRFLRYVTCLVAYLFSPLNTGTITFC